MELKKLLHVVVYRNGFGERPWLMVVSLIYEAETKFSLTIKRQCPQFGRGWLDAQEKEKPRSCWQQERGRTENKPDELFFQVNCTTAPHKFQSRRWTEMKISGYLHKGAENGLKLTELVQLTRMDERTLRRAINTERKMGVPVVSDCVNGYFLAENEHDLTRFRRSMEHRAGEIMKIVRATDDLIYGMTGQLRMGG